MAITDRNGDITVRVPGDYNNPRTAFDFLKTQTLLDNATATIQIAPGKYFFDDEWIANHSQGGNIQILGESTDVVFEWTSSGLTQGLRVTDGHTLGLLNNVTIQLPTKAGSTALGTGLSAWGGASLICGSNVTIKNWYYGIAANWSSFVFADFAHVSNGGDANFFSWMNSMIRCRNATSLDARSSDDNLGAGFVAENGSAMDCQRSYASGNYRAGFSSFSVSSMRAQNSTSENNTFDGFIAQYNSFIDARFTGVSGNGSTDYNAVDNSIILS